MLIQIVPNFLLLYIMSSFYSLFDICVIHFVLMCYYCVLLLLFIIILLFVTWHELRGPLSVYFSFLFFHFFLQIYIFFGKHSEWNENRFVYITQKCKYENVLILCLFVVFLFSFVIHFMYFAFYAFTSFQYVIFFGKIFIICILTVSLFLVLHLMKSKEIC